MIHHFLTGFDTVLVLYVNGCAFSVYVCVILSSCAPGVLLLSQFDGGGLGSDGNPVFVQRFDQNLSHVFVVRVKVEDVSHHVGQTFVREFLRRRRRGNMGRKISR